MRALELTVRAVTPVYLAGAEPNAPEWRAPSFKGLLRFWYRAFDPDFLFHEPALFGGAGGTHGQSPFLLRVDANGPPRRWGWDQAAVGRFDEGRGRNTKNGIRYLANMGLSDRQAIAPGAECTMRILYLRGDTGAGGPPRPARQSVAALSPRRRGESEPARVRQLLARTMGAAGPVAGDRGSAVAGRLQGRRRRTFVPGPRAEDAAVAGVARMAEERPEARRGAACVAAEPAHRPGFGVGLPLRAPSRVDSRPTDRTHGPTALNEAGRTLQDFRVRREPDYSDVKASLSERRPPRRAPERATFGLPIAFPIPGRSGSGPVSGLPRNPGRRSYE